MSHGHEQQSNSIFKVGMNLAIACFLSGAVIASTYAMTAPIAAQERINQKNKAMKELVADAQEFKPVDGKTDWYAALKDGKIVAYVVPAESKGYGGAIKMVTAISPDGKVIDYKILAHNETPGLGDKAAEPKFRKQFAGKAAQDLEVVKTPTDKNIQALTGATITSRAVTKGIREAAEQVAAYAASQKK
ncbi:electron transport complex, RnfABCDGE type, G subunit [Thermosinus carboxydivorans Nor1]|uniref:Ion-translocating oxidoreductase complex subunit G n=1 Tax=Thermosinus carboxydivorans Nor1 TaxID=401526 RepID=A1HP15_9FIRM|nr:RnfABCDGE type electron transport complex subunit G [Thermosinus carboxydivorans]EAX48123.1 electron transport complex, RnfABCDGE type, G subunit [Thermosinus carboxydivorans Nor1]